MKKRTHTLPIYIGDDPENPKQIGVVQMKMSEGQASVIHSMVLMPNYNIEPTGEKTVVSFNAARRADVLHPIRLKQIASMEAKGIQHYADTRKRDK